MAWSKKWIFIVLTQFFVLCETTSQCHNSFGNILGSIVEDERGYSLTDSPDGKYIYVGGIKKDSALIIKVSVSGSIQWTRTFDIVPGKADHIHRLFVDSDGMIAGAGTSGSQVSGGTIFAFRYNPETNVILWANEYVSTSNNYCQGMIEINPGGHYLLSDNPSSPNVAELIALERTTGKVVTGFSKHYDLGSSESIFDFATHNGYLYANGRFSDGGSVAEMRNTLLKIDPDNGNVEWMKLGHKNGNETARLYGFDLVILQDEIYSIYLGDPSGTSVDNTLIYLQKTSLNGEIVWLKEYDLPAANDWVDEIIESNGDLVILARNRISPSNMILFKTNTQGDILWSNEYDFSLNDNATPIGSVQSQLIEVDEHYFFTAYAEGPGLADMILVKTDSQGRIENECEAVRPVIIEVSDLENPVFYSKDPIVYPYLPQVKSMAVVAGISSSIISTTVCSTEATASTTYTTKMICEGDMYMGFTESGLYQDTFLTSSGCDSIIVLELNIVPSISSMIQMSICPGDEYEGYVESGVYVDTLTSKFGCDSIRTLTLTVALPETHVIATICSGGNFDGYEEEGMYMDTLQGISNECDTLRHLTITILPTIRTTIEATICAGEHYYHYTDSGIYTDTIITHEGCDSIRTVHLEVMEDVYSYIETNTCSTDRDGYNVPGIFTDTLVTSNGCDSIRTLSIVGAARYIPNVFSPNQDNINDLFEIFSFPNEEVELVYFAIFDRFGDMVYENKYWPVIWDGKNKHGDFYNPAVFTYILKYLCDQGEVVETGTITLVR
jgi:gliding motility-associated-like protein